MLDKNSALFIFQGTFAIVISDSFIILPHLSPLVNTFFEKNLKNFELMLFAQKLPQFHAFSTQNIPIEISTHPTIPINVIFSPSRNVPIIIPVTGSVIEIIPASAAPSYLTPA